MAIISHQLKEELFMPEKIKTEMMVGEHKIGVLRINNREYISLTDLARYADEEEPKIPVYAWMRNRDVLAYLGLWEKMNNKEFKGHEFVTFKNEAGGNSFYLSPQKWIKATNAIGIISKSGRYDSGTYAVPDIAFEFASWLSPEFKLYVIQEFQRLKKIEAYQNKIDWQANRILAKVNYLIHTDAVKNFIVPVLTEKQKRFVYAEEADLLHLVILNNLENINAELIEMGALQQERLVKLNQIAIRQTGLLGGNKNFDKLLN